MSEWASEREGGCEGVRDNGSESGWHCCKHSFQSMEFFICSPKSVSCSRRGHGIIFAPPSISQIMIVPIMIMTVTIHSHTLTHTTLIHFQLSSATPKLKQYTVSVDRSLVYWFAHLAAGLVSVQSVAPTVGHSSHTQWQLKCLGLFNNFALWPPCWLD